MRRKGKLPLKKKYFHTKRKIDRKDIAFLKRKVETIKQKKLKNKREKKEKRKFWY
jgi:hypothetical protein